MIEPNIQKRKTVDFPNIFEKEYLVGSIKCYVTETITFQFKNKSNQLTPSQKVYNTVPYRTFLCSCHQFGETSPCQDEYSGNTTRKSLVNQACIKKCKRCFHNTDGIFNDIEKKCRRRIGTSMQTRTDMLLMSYLFFCLIFLN